MNGSQGQGKSIPLTKYSKRWAGGGGGVLSKIDQGIKKSHIPPPVQRTRTEPRQEGSKPDGTRKVGLYIMTQG